MNHLECQYYHGRECPGKCDLNGAPCDRDTGYPCDELEEVETEPAASACGK